MTTKKPLLAPLLILLSKISILITAENFPICETGLWQCCVALPGGAEGAVAAGTTAAPVATYFSHLC